MTKNWYAVYTRKEREKKVAAYLTKKGIKNYFPVNNVINTNVNNKKIYKEALFSSTVFVYISEAEMSIVKKIPGTINFLYWLAKPAVINREEIEAVKQLTSVYHTIRVEKSAVNIRDTVRIIDEPVILFSDKAASVKFQTLKIVLPSLGYTMIAERDKINKDQLQPEHDLDKAALFPKAINTFFSN